MNSKLRLNCLKIDRCYVLIELHTHLGFDEQEFIERFRSTHRVERFVFAGRDALSRADYASFLSEDEFRLAVNELRAEGQAWLFATPLQR